MNYSYNYGFLSQFVKENDLTKKDILEALGVTDYQSLNKWMQGKVPMHITAMMRLCNYYNIDISNFFFDDDAMPKITPQMPTAESMTLPADNYGMAGGKGYGIVETRITKRITSSQQQAKAVARGLQRQADQRQRQAEAMAAMAAASAGSPNCPDCPENPENPEYPGSPAYPGNPTSTLTTPYPTPEIILRLQLDHMREMRDSEREHHEREDSIRRECQASFDAERNRLMSIIERQSAELSKLYSQNQQRGLGRIDMVADDISTN